MISASSSEGHPGKANGRIQRGRTEIRSLQRRVGFAVFTAAVAVASLNFYRYVGNESEHWLTAASSLEVAVVLLSGLVALGSALIDRTFARAMQVAAFMVNGYIAALDADPGNLTSTLFVGYGYLLALEYGFLRRRFRLKTTIVALSYAAVIAVGLTVIDPAQPFAIIYAAVGIGVMIYVFWLMVDLRTQRHLDREANLEELVEQRTASLQERVAESERLKSELERSLYEKERLIEEKDVLLKEVHHRTKNNMQVVSSLLNLENSAITDPAARKAIWNSTLRIRTLATAHEHLYRSGDLVRIDLQSYLTALLREHWDNVCATSATLSVEVATEVEVDLDFAIPLGLILNELVTNAAKHAFSADAPGKARVIVDRDGDTLVIAVSDDGEGFTPSFTNRRPDGFGLRLVYGLVEQLGGSAEHAISEAGGTEWNVALQLPAMAG